MTLIEIAGVVYDAAVNLERRAVLAALYPNLTSEELEILDRHALELDEERYHARERGDL